MWVKKTPLNKPVGREKPVAGTVVVEKAQEKTGARERFQGFAALKVRAFQYYIVSSGFMQAAENMQTLANGWYAFHLTGSTAILGLTLLAQAIPQTLLSFAGGVMSDRFPRRTIWMVCLVLSAMLSFWIGISVILDTIIWQDLVIRSFFFGIIFAFRMPAKMGIISELVGRDRIMSAVSLNQALTNVMQFAGPAASGFLIALMGIEWAYMIVTGFFFLSLVVLLPMRYERKNTAIKKQGSFIGNVKDGWDYVRGTPNIAAVLGIGVLATAFAQPYTQLLPAFADVVLKVGPAQLGLLSSLSGIGALGGSLGITLLRPKMRGLLLIRVAFFTGIGVVAFCLTGSFVFSGIMVLLLGVAQALRGNLQQILLQTYTADGYLGRVLSIQLTQAGLTSLTAFAVALAAEAVGVQRALTGTGILLTVVGGAYYLFSRRLRQLA